LIAISCSYIGYIRFIGCIRLRNAAIFNQFNQSNKLNP
jgi:hypothetical protein